MIKLNEKAPEFSLKDKDGKEWNLSRIKSKYTVVYFYPKDNTPGCTLEAKWFTDLKKEFEKEGAVIIGISGGDNETKKRFCEKHSLEITLLSDTDFKVSKNYRVYGEKSFLGKKYMGIIRSTFLLDKDKKIIKIFEKVNPISHPKALLGEIKEINKTK